MKKVHDEILVIRESEINDPEVRRQVWMTPNSFVSDEDGAHLQPFCLRSGMYKSQNDLAHRHGGHTESAEVKESVAPVVFGVAPCSPGGVELSDSGVVICMVSVFIVSVQIGIGLLLLIGQLWK